MAEMKSANGSAQFQAEAKQYVINMLDDSRVLHIKNGCQYAGVFFAYCDFDSVEEAERSGIAFRKCEVCFSEETGGTQ